MRSVLYPARGSWPRLVGCAAVSVLLWCAAGAQAAPERTDPTKTLNAEQSERGWFFYQDPPKPAPPASAPQATPVPAKPDPEPPAERCKTAATWTVECGFIDPGKDFAFMEKQRDALLQNMTMSRNDPKAVEQFQYYMKWVVERAVEVANVWQYNLVQNPQLDPEAQAPAISTFGLKLMTQVREAKDDEIFKTVREEGGLLVFFTRHDCKYCTAMAPAMRRLEKDTGIPVWNAALDETCLPAFAERCRKGKQVTGPATLLQVSVVPTVFLYVKPNTWIRISNGLSTTDTMKSRLVQFFAAYRGALLKGVDNGSALRAPVDFSAGAQMLEGGTPGAPAGGPSRPPTESEVRKLLQQ